MRRCYICGVHSKNSEVFLIDFPKDEATKIIWKVRLGIINKKIIKSARICSAHFPQQDIKNCRLRPGALPNVIDSNDENDPLNNLTSFNAQKNMLSTKLESVQSTPIESMNGIKIMGIFNENEMGTFNNE